MEMSELQQAWRGLDERLIGLEAVARTERRRRILGDVRWRLGQLGLGQAAQVLVGLAFVIFAGGFWTANWGTPHLVVYGLAMHVYGLALIVPAAMQLVGILRLDPQAPVLAVQARLLALRRLRIRSERVLLVAGMLAWVPILFALAAHAGMDLWPSRPGVVLSNLGVGLALAALVAWLTRRYRDAFERDAVGRSLAQAEADLAELAGSGVGGER